MGISSALQSHAGGTRGRQWQVNPTWTGRGRTIKSGAVEIPVWSLTWVLDGEDGVKAEVTAILPRARVQLVE